MKDDDVVDVAMTYLFKIIGFFAIPLTPIIIIAALDDWLKAHLGWFGSILAHIVDVGSFFLFLYLLFGRPRRNLTSRGTAHFASHDELKDAGLLSDEGLVLGREDSHKAPLIRYTGPGHLLTIAPTRAGKGVGAIIPNLLITPKSVVCIDPKGENAIATAQARRDAGQEVYILDPWGITGDISASFNPLTWLDVTSEDAAEDAALLADALVYDAPGSEGDAHWNEEAKALIGGMLLHVASLPPGRRSMASFRDCLTLPSDRFAALLKEMQSSTAAYGLIARAANRMLSKSDRESAGVLSSAQRHTHFLDSPKMQRVLQTGTLKLDHLKQYPTSLYLVLPPDRLSSFGRWLRLMVTLTITAMARAKGEQKVLFLLDEFAALGPLPAVQTAMGLMAGYGMQIWPILQDLNQLRALYRLSAGTFLSNAAVLQAFGTADHETAKHLSEMLGQQTIEVTSRGRSHSQRSAEPFDDSRSDSNNTSEVGRSLLMPDEIRRMDAKYELLFVQGQPPIQALKVRYYEDRAFKDLSKPLKPREAMPTLFLPFMNGSGHPTDLP